MHFEDAVLIPVFKQALEVEWHSYYPVATIMHRGSYTGSGHYQAYQALLRLVGFRRMITVKPDQLLLMPFNAAMYM